MIKQRIPEIKVEAIGTQWLLGMSIWEEGDYVITIRPATVASWRDAPIGCTLSASDAERVLRWLPSALDSIMQIAQNIAR